MRLAALIAFLALFAIVSPALAGPEFDRGVWAFDQQTGVAGVAADNGKLAVRCEGKRQYLELTPFAGFGAGGRPDRKVWVKFDQGDFAWRVWLHDASSAVLKDYTYVNEYLQKARTAKVSLFMTAKNGKGDKVQFSFSAIGSAEAIRLAGEACRSS